MVILHIKINYTGEKNDAESILTLVKCLVSFIDYKEMGSSLTLNVKF